MAAKLRVAVVGSGLGGLSSAAHLHRLGHDVTVFEAAPRVGGKAGRVERAGFRFDTGPTLLTLPEVVRRAFSAVDASLDADVGLTPIAPVCRYFFPEGQQFDVTSDIQATARAIDRVFPGEGNAYARLMHRSEQTWQLAGEPYLEAPFRGYTDFVARVLKTRGIAAAKLGTSLGTLDSVARSHFTSPALQAFVGRFSTYVGGAPEQSSAAFAMLPHVEHQLGALHPHGGMAAIAYALADRLRQRGVRIELDSPVERLLVREGIVYGLQLRNSSTPKFFDAVIANVDPEIVYERWAPDGTAARNAVTALKARERSLSGFALLLGVRGSIGALAHHTVLFPKDYAAEFKAIFRENRICDEPTIYVCAPGRTEAGVAPEGCHSLFVLVNAPATGYRSELWENTDALEEHILSRLESYVPGLRSRVVVRDRVTPSMIEALGSPQGAIYGEAPHGPTAPFRRPKQRSEVYSGLYFVGGSVHPGGGVPMVTLGGEHAATLVHEDARTLSQLHSRNRTERVVQR